MVNYNVMPKTKVRIILSILILNIFFGGLGFGVPNIVNTASADHCGEGLVHSTTTGFCEGATSDPVVTNTETTKQNKDSGNDFESRLGECKVTSSDGWSACLKVTLYYFGVTIPSSLLVLSAKLFDYMLNLTLNSSMYEQKFIEKIWSVIRDFANIGFILVLIYAAFQTVLGIDHGGKKLIANVVIMALLVNFSLFFTKIIIDPANILAKLFYNTIRVVDGGTVGTSLKPVSEALASSFDINIFFNQDFIKTIAEESNAESIVDLQSQLETENNKTLLKRWKELKLYCLLPFMDIPFDHCEIKHEVIAEKIAERKRLDNGEIVINVSQAISYMVIYGIIVYILIYVFVVVALSMLGRTLELILLMIVSPFAFVSRAVPGLADKEFGFDKWVHKLISTSFMVTIFVFLLYVTSEILNAQIFEVAKDNATGMERLIVWLFPAILIACLLWKGMKYAIESSGMFTEHIISVAQKLGGAALTGGAVLGAAGLQKVVGEHYLKKAEDPALRERAASGHDKDAENKLARYNALSKNSFDLRKAPGMSWIQKQTGVDATHGLLGLGGEKSFEGGAAEAQKKAKHEDEKKFETYGMTAEEKAEQNKKAATWKEGFDKTEKDAEAAVKSQATSKFNEEEWIAKDSGDIQTQPERMAGAKKSSFNEDEWIKKDNENMQKQMDVAQVEAKRRGTKFNPDTWSGSYWGASNQQQRMENAKKSSFNEDEWIKKDNENMQKQMDVAQVEAKRRGTKFNPDTWSGSYWGASNQQQRMENAKKEVGEKVWNEKKEAFKESYEAGGSLAAYGLKEGEMGVKKVGLSKAEQKKEEEAQRSAYFESKKSDPEKAKQERIKKEKAREEFKKNLKADEKFEGANEIKFEEGYKTLAQENKAKIDKVREDGELKKFKENFEAAGGTFDKAKEDKFRKDFNSEWGKNKRMVRDFWSSSSLSTTLAVGAGALLGGAPVAATTYITIKGLSAIKHAFEITQTDNTREEEKHEHTQIEKLIKGLESKGVPHAEEAAHTIVEATKEKPAGDAHPTGSGDAHTSHG
ncbi:MAG: hypothetical protein AAB693_01890 [Patescibacteria group bacterium]